MDELIEQLRSRMRPKPEPASKPAPAPAKSAPRSKFEPWLQLAREFGVPIEVSKGV